MKNTLKIMLLLLALATLGSCVKEPVKRRNIAPKQNELIYNTTNYKMSVSPIESCQDEFDIVGPYHRPNHEVGHSAFLRFWQPLGMAFLT